MKQNEVMFQKRMQLLQQLHESQIAIAKGDRDNYMDNPLFAASIIIPSNYGAKSTYLCQACGTAANSKCNFITHHKTNKHFSNLIVWEATPNDDDEDDQDQPSPRKKRKKVPSIKIKLSKDRKSSGNNQ